MSERSDSVVNTILSNFGLKIKVVLVRLWCCCTRCQDHTYVLPHEHFSNQFAWMENPVSNSYICLIIIILLGD